MSEQIEWHSVNELCRKVDVVEAVLNLAESLDDVVDVIMGVPTIEIVGCKDCKWKDKPMIQKDVRCVRACYENVSDDHYCGFGERKADD